MWHYFSVAMKLNVKYQNAALNQDRIDIVCVLLMKIRGYFEMQAFNVRKEQTVRYVGTLADFIRDVSHSSSLLLKWYQKENLIATFVL